MAFESTIDLGLSFNDMSGNELFSNNTLNHSSRNYTTTKDNQLRLVSINLNNIIA